MEATDQRAIELICPRNSGNKFNSCLFTLVELPTVTAYRRYEHETRVRGRIMADWITHDCEAVISIKRSDLELDLHSELDVNLRRRELVLPSRHLDHLRSLIICLQVHP